MSGDVKSVVLSWRASIRTCGEDKDGDFPAFLCKTGICSRLGEISKFFPTSIITLYGGKDAFKL